MPVYMIRAGEHGPVKLGWADDVDARCKQLQTSHHEQLHVVRTIQGVRATERWFHTRFAASRMRAEWFRFHPDMLTVEPPHMGEPAAKEPRPRYALVSWASEMCRPERRCPACLAAA